MWANTELLVGLYVAALDVVPGCDGCLGLSCHNTFIITLCAFKSDPQITVAMIGIYSFITIEKLFCVAIPLYLYGTILTTLMLHITSA